MLSHNLSTNCLKAVDPSARSIIPRRLFADFSLVAVAKRLPQDFLDIIGKQEEPISVGLAGVFDQQYFPSTAASPEAA
jgi:hypothetical protein